MRLRINKPLLHFLGGFLLAAVSVAQYPTDSFSSDYFNQVRAYYTSRKSIAENFFNRSAKKIHVYVVDKELLQTGEEFSRQSNQNHIGGQLYQHFLGQIPSYRTQVIFNTVESKDDIDIRYTEADIIILLSSEVVFSQEQYPEQQNSVSMVDLNLNIRFFLPAVYGEEPVGDFYVKDSIMNRPYTNKTMMNLLLDKLNRLYVWKESEKLLNYLNGDTKFRPYLTGRLAMNENDFFAARLLALSDWEQTQKYLLQQSSAETLVYTQLLYPFSDKLSGLIYSYARGQSNIADKVKLLSYLYASGYPHLTELLNSVLSEVSGPELMFVASPAIALAGKVGNKETLEHLNRIQDVVLEDDRDTTVKIFRNQVRSNITALEKRL